MCRGRVRLSDVPAGRFTSGWEVPSFCSVSRWLWSKSGWGLLLWWLGSASGQQARRPWVVNPWTPKHCLRRRVSLFVPSAPRRCNQFLRKGRCGCQRPLPVVCLYPVGGSHRLGSGEQTQGHDQARLTSPSEISASEGRASYANDMPVHIARSHRQYHAAGARRRPRSAARSRCERGSFLRRVHHKAPPGGFPLSKTPSTPAPIFMGC